MIVDQPIAKKCDDPSQFTGPIFHTAFELLRSGIGGSARGKQEGSAESDIEERISMTLDGPYSVENYRSQCVSCKHLKHAGHCQIYQAIPTGIWDACETCQYFEAITEKKQP